MNTQNLKSMKNMSAQAGLVIALLILTATLAIADDFTKTYKEKYTVQKGATLDITNKFGDIHCQVWEESSVAITVTVTVDASSQEKANKVMDKITVTLSGSASLVQGKTEVGSTSSDDFSIDYDIMMPRWMNIDLDHGFGEVYLGEVEGTTKINLEYGALRAAALNGTGTDLNIKFSESVVEYLKDGKVNVEYGGFQSESVGNLKLLSRFSQVIIDKTENLNLDSQYDEIQVGSTGQVVAIGRFSEMKFDKITGSFEFDSEYGDVEIGYIAPGFGSGKVRNSFAGTDLNFDANATFNVDVEVQFGDLDYPSSKASLNKQTIGYTTNIYKGKIGSGSSSAGQITVRSKHANVNIEYAR